MDMTIGRFAAEGAVGVETIRFYQRKGLLNTPKRVEGGRRYGPEELRRLQFIRQAQTAGFSLEEIGELLDLDASDDRERAREAARNRLAALNARIAELNRTREALERLVSECSSGKSGPCPILRSFGL